MNILLFLVFDFTIDSWSLCVKCFYCFVLYGCVNCKRPKKGQNRFMEKVQ